MLAVETMVIALGKKIDRIFSPPDAIRCGIFAAPKPWFRQELPTMFRNH
jgi:hypothetical protein